MFYPLYLLDFRGLAMTYVCPICNAENKIVNQCGCDKDNLPTKPVNVLEVCDLNDGTYASVYQDDTYRYLAITDDTTNLGLIQGRVLLSYQNYLYESYARSIVSLSRAWPLPQSITLMGHGIGGLLRSFKNNYPATMIRTVEKYLHVLTLTEKYFLGQSLSSEGVYRLKDYMEYLTWPSARNQDILVIDIFTYETRISDMTNPESFKLCAGLLSESGVLAVNLVGASDEIDKVFEVVDTVFPYVYRYPIGADINILLFASQVAPVCHVLVDLEEFTAY